jgi:ribosomal protein RSM22 (predicted rRNA methylase)
MKWLPGAMSENIYEGKFTYLIARKGMTKEEDVHPWSRVIEQPLVQKNNLICRLCTERGKLEEVLFRKARSTMKKDLSKDDFMKTRAVFKYAKSLKCGDRAQFILDEPKTTTDTDDNDVIAADEFTTTDKHKWDPQLEHNPEHQPNN